MPKTRWREKGGLGAGGFAHVGLGGAHLLHRWIVLNTGGHHLCCTPPEGCLRGLQQTQQSCETTDGVQICSKANSKHAGSALGPQSDPWVKLLSCTQHQGVTAPIGKVLLIHFQRLSVFYIALCKLLGCLRDYKRQTLWLVTHASQFASALACLLLNVEQA